MAQQRGAVLSWRAAALCSEEHSDCASPPPVVPRCNQQTNGTTMGLRLARLAPCHKCCRVQPTKGVCIAHSPILSKCSCNWYRYSST